jgi:demethylmenaquinone methyltransferase/2-methoxy-6-polyprenyl-1,4-benzoquinol methylase
VDEGLLAKRGGDIRAMFDRIAPRYDLLNRLLSLGIDVRWRRAVVARTRKVDAPRVLDVCTGTGDLALAFPASVDVAGCDFSLPMLATARMKAVRRGRNMPLVVCDALQLPMRPSSVDIVTVAFGIRNFEDLATGLRELARVIRPGGILLALEFSRPRGVLAPLLGWWVRRVPPRLGRMVSRDRDAYIYLSESVASFANADEVCGLLGRTGFGSIAAHRLTWGVATVYEAVRTTAGIESNEEER